MLFGSSVALQEIGLLANMFLGGFSFSLSSSVLLSGQAKSGSGFHTGHGWFFCPSRRACLLPFVFGCRFFSQVWRRFASAGQNPPCVFCGRRVAPGFFCGRAPPLCGPSWVSGFGWPEARCFPLSLSSLVVPFVFLCCLVRPHFF